MTQEEREEIQARYNVAESYLKWTGELISEKLTDSVRDIPALLDALISVEVQSKETNYWKNQVKIRDKAIQESPDPCWFCANVNECPGDCEFDFDEGRFTKGAGE